jgi:hypothetical protein
LNPIKAHDITFFLVVKNRFIIFFLGGENLPNLPSMVPSIAPARPDCVLKAQDLRDSLSSSSESPACEAAQLSGLDPAAAQRLK